MDVDTLVEMKELKLELEVIKERNPALFYVKTPLLYRTLNLLNKIIKEDNL